MNKLDNTKFKALRLKAIRYAKFRRASDELAQDFAQEYCLAVWKGQTDKLLYQWANFVRRELGRKGKRLVYFDPHIDTIVNVNFDRRLQIIEMRDCIAKLEDKKFRILLTLILHDVTQVQIAEIFGVHETRISQMYKKALAQLKRQYAAV